MANDPILVADACEPRAVAMTCEAVALSPKAAASQFVALASCPIAILSPLGVGAVACALFPIAIVPVEFETAFVPKAIEFCPDAVLALLVDPAPIAIELPPLAVPEPAEY